jgi:cytochrome b561
MSVGPLSRHSPQVWNVARYTQPAVLLHWAIALLILGLFPLGLYMVELPVSPDKLKLYSYHKWAGVTVFLLAALQLAWRWRHAPPPLPVSLPPWQRHAAHRLHGVLYMLMLAVPLTGWWMGSAYGFTTSWFGVLPLPDLLPRDEALGDALRLVHEYLNYVFMVCVTGHVGAALKHQLIDRDGMLYRMWIARRE